MKNSNKIKIIKAGMNQTANHVEPKFCSFCSPIFTKKKK